MKHLFLSSDILLLTFTAIELLDTTKFIFIFFSANNYSHVTHAFTVLRTWFQKLTSWDLFNLRTSLDWSEGNGLIFRVNRSCPLDNMSISCAQSLPEQSKRARSCTVRAEAACH